MAIPDFQTCMLPFLRFLGDGQERQLKDAVKALAAEFKLTTEQLSELLPSGSQPVFINRVGWAKSYLRKAGLIEYPRRSFCRITPAGQKVLVAPPNRITMKFLEQFPGYQVFKRKRPDEEIDSPQAMDETAPVSTPLETLELAYQQLRAELASEIAQALHSAEPDKFERIVVELLVRMGYGGNLADAGKAIGKTGDEGIDGVIKEDHLGLDNIYVQAKKWNAKNVGGPDLQQFAGALQGQRARKGVFITTSEFTKQARDFVQKIDAKIVLIDGKALCELMIDFNVGVTPTKPIELKKIDLDFFTED